LLIYIKNIRDVEHFVAHSPSRPPPFSITTSAFPSEMKKPILDAREKKASATIKKRGARRARQEKVKESRGMKTARRTDEGALVSRAWLTPYKRNLKACEQKWTCFFGSHLQPSPLIAAHLLDAIFHIDHIIPLHRGGTNDWTNLCALCLQCHGKKTAFENDQSWDLRREPILGLSKYFSPGSTFFLSTPIPPPGVLGRPLSHSN
jgi:hypothetical protein